MENLWTIVIVVILIIVLVYYVVYMKDEGMSSDKEANLIVANTFTGNKEGYTTAGSRYPTQMPHTELSWMDTVEEMQLDPQVRQNHQDWSKNVAEKFYSGAVFNKTTGDLTTNQSNFVGFGGIRHKLGLAEIGKSARQVPSDEEADMLDTRVNNLQWSPQAASAEYFASGRGSGDVALGRLPDRGERIASDFSAAERGYGYLNANF